MSRLRAPRTAPALGAVLDAGQEGKHEAESLLNRRLVRGGMRYLVRWRGHASADDEWLRVEETAVVPSLLDAARPADGCSSVALLTSLASESLQV